MSKYYSIHEFSKIIGVSAQTLRNWDANGKLHPHHTTVSGYRYYSDEQLNQVINVKPKNRITIGYCRVSSHKQKGDLERQIDNVKTYLLAKGQPFEIISDIGFGINYKKKGLQELIRRISQNQVEKVVVLYKDRLLRFGFELIEYIASLYNCEIEIIDNTEKSEQQELVEDLVQIITVFSCKLQGKRANIAKKLIAEEVKEARRDEIMELQQEISYDKGTDRIGQELLVMIEGKVADESAYIGRTYGDAPKVDGYIFVQTGELLMTGDFAKVRVTGALEYDLIGELADEYTE